MQNRETLLYKIDFIFLFRCQDGISFDSYDSFVCHKNDLYTILGM